MLGRELRSWGYLESLHNRELRSYPRVSKYILGNCIPWKSSRPNIQWLGLLGWSMGQGFPILPWYKVWSTWTSCSIRGSFWKLHEQWKKTWLFSVYRGWNSTQLYRDYFINHVRIPMNQPGWLMESKAGFFSWLTCDLEEVTWKFPEKIGRYEVMTLFPGFPYLDVPGRKLGSLVRIYGSYSLLINGVFWCYNPLTNLLLTSWDIQVHLPHPILQEPTSSHAYLEDHPI